ncbi:TPA: hypothetical protein JG914_000092 [Enterobacter hormaechei subsp. steigerwaltii]|nr:hypothetical protein [Enterobacter hormaechei subsp. steigerwaltii]
MKAYKQIMLIFMALLAFNVHASDLIFKCNFKNHKQVSLYKNSNGIIYSFGKIDAKPDLELNQKKSQVDANLGNLSGRFATNSIEIKNGNYGYKLTTSVDRIAEEQVPSTSLTVIKDSNDLTTLQCIKGSEVGTLLSIND